MNCPSSRTSRKRDSSSGISGAYCALTSTSGIGCTAFYCSGLPPSVYEIHREEQDTCKHNELHVPERVVEALVARAEGVAGARDPERPDGGADRGQHRVRPERDVEDARRNRDEGPHDRRHAAEQDAFVPPAAEPALGAVDLLRR